MATASVTLRTMMNFSLFHMMAAAQFGRTAGLLEEEHKGKEFADFWNAIAYNVSSCIIISAATLEAYINEVFALPESFFPEYDADFMKEIWTVLEEKPILAKFQFALVLKKKQRMKTGENPYQDADTLIKMRNALVHFSPEWCDEKDVHAKIEKRIEGKFALSPFVLGIDIFPQRSMSYGCAKWSVETVLAFVDDFSTKSGIDNRFQKHMHRLDWSLNTQNKPPETKQVEII